MIKYSLIIPCYNEAKTLPTLISSLVESFSSENAIEIILVNNGSRDESSAILEEASSQYSFLRIVTIDVNQGYGHGILQGLALAKGEFLGWTHADMQTNPHDVLKGFNFFETKAGARLFVKGRRYGRPLSDSFFTLGMSIFDSLLFFLPLWDINAQPTLFSRAFYESWKNPPQDFSLDLFAYASAVHQGYSIQRFPVHFGKRLHGNSHWNIDWKSKVKFIKRTIDFSFILRKEWRK